MSTPERRAGRIDEATAGTLIAAIEAYFDGKGGAVLCDLCRTPIEILNVGEAAWEHRCSCGKYTGSLKGL